MKAHTTTAFFLSAGLKDCLPLAKFTCLVLLRHACQTAAATYSPGPLGSVHSFFCRQTPAILQQHFILMNLFHRKKSLLSYTKQLECFL